MILMFIEWFTRMTAVRSQARQHPPPEGALGSPCRSRPTRTPYASHPQSTCSNLGSHTDKIRATPASEYLISEPLELWSASLWWALSALQYCFERFRLTYLRKKTKPFMGKSRDWSYYKNFEHATCSQSWMTKANQIRRLYRGEFGYFEYRQLFAFRRREMVVFGSSFVFCFILCMRCISGNNFRYAWTCRVHVYVCVCLVNIRKRDKLIQRQDAQFIMHNRSISSGPIWKFLLIS